MVVRKINFMLGRYGIIISRLSDTRNHVWHCTLNKEQVHGNHVIIGLSRHEDWEELI